MNPNSSYLDAKNPRRLHVKNDLDSYVCLFEGCESPEEVYSNSGTWLKHMSSHYMRWRCVSKSHVEFQSTTKSEYIDHMKIVHPDKFTDAQLNILAPRIARPSTSMFKPCPLCGNNEFNGNRADHVAEHLHLLALKSLPNYEEHIEEQKEVKYQQPHLPISNTRGKSAIRQESRNNSTFIARAAVAQSSSALKKGETAIHRPVRTSPRQQQRQRNEAIAQELQRWREGFGSQQASIRSSNNGQQAATIFPIQENLLKQQSAFETALPTSSGEKSSEEMGKVSRLKQWMTPREHKIVDDGALLLEYPGAETPAKQAHFSLPSPTPRNFNDFIDQHESKGEEKEGEEDGSIDGDEFELPSLAKHAIQSHLEPMDMNEEEEEEEEEHDTWESPL